MKPKKLAAGEVDIESPKKADSVAPVWADAMSPNVQQVLAREKARAKQAIIAVKQKAEAESEAKIKQQQKDTMNAVKEANQICNELKLALVNEQRSREDANRRADESHELLVQAKNQLKSQQQKTTQLLQSGKEKVREALEIEWADFMAEYQEESAAKLVKAEKKFETQKKENKKLKKQVRRLMCDYQ
jgi:hypothetical protein